MNYDQLFEEFNVEAARQICLESEVRSRTEHELELKEKLRAKYDARGVLLREKDVEIARLKSLVEEKETESAEVPRLRDQVSVLTAEKSFFSAEVSALKSVVSQKNTDISLLNSRATYLKYALHDSHAACTEAKNLISTLTSERDGLASEKMKLTERPGPGVVQPCARTEIPGWMRSWIVFAFVLDLHNLVIDMKFIISDKVFKKQC
ncbi:hypothetical protein Tco_0717731 [Tanacetum coccineum]